MAHNGNSNWVKINRSIFDNFLWKKNTPFDVRSAWIDLILLANHEDGQFMTSRGELIKIPRGSHFTSTRSLAERWHWNRDTVSRYIRTLVDAEMLTQTATHSGTLLSLVNYDNYQGGAATDHATHRAADHTTDHTAEYATDHARTRIEEEIENEEEREEAPHLGGWVLDEQGRYEWDDTARSSYDFSNDSRQLDIPQSTPRSRVEQLRNLLRGISTLPGGGSPTGDSQCDS